MLDLLFALEQHENLIIHLRSAKHLPGIHAISASPKLQS
ncbi:hypothetical protein NECAME_03169 [Necator americanus]|uniref:Uncharacterized protein n=1 Tax=Necator americanus TaxID=51031 RepID=W2T666_NECAM|nr:hypothetical protein NECAME_03169 [Necator americanus]ETN77505.1 hypothetical protein NECAME_03169 [Necator americanus]